MLRQRLLEAHRQFDSIRNILTVSNRAREKDVPYGFELFEWDQEGADPAYWKAFDHCAAVARCYATFERFILDSVGEWINWCLRFDAGRIVGSKNARTLYEIGLAEILRRQSETRFAALDRGRLAQGVALFYASTLPEPTVLSVDPFFATQPNLKLSHINDLFKAVELGSPQDWIGKSELLRDFCIAEGFNIEEELRQLVDRRNEAVHGNKLPSNILGTNELVLRIELLKLLCAAIYEFILAQVCRAELGDDFEKGLIGSVTNVWPKVGAFELTVARPVLYVDAPVLMIGPATVVGSSIRSIQIENVQTLGFSGGAGVPLGITLDFMPSEGMRMIDRQAIRGLSSLMDG